MEKTAPVKHLLYLDGLRGLAALYVVLHHAFLMATEASPMTGLALELSQPFRYGRYAVDVFIVLSGFCLMLPIEKGDGKIRGGIWNFFQRRAWRILPTYYLALLLSWALATTVISQKTGTLWDLAIPVTTDSVIHHFLLIHDAFEDGGTIKGHTINYVFWSIAVEWRIYFLFPLLVWAWHRFGGVKTTVIAFFSAYLLYFVIHRFLRGGLTSYYIALFAMGMLATSIAFSSSNQYDRLRRLPWAKILLVMTLLVIFFTRFRTPNGNLLPVYMRDGLVGLWAMTLLITIARSEKGWLLSLLNYKPVVFMGTFAYSTYLIHAPLLQLLWQYVFIPWQKQPIAMFLIMCLIGTPLILLTSYLFFLVCERPFLARKPKSSDPITTTPALEPAK